MLAGFSLPSPLPASSVHSLSVSAAIGNVSLDQNAGNERLQLDAEVQQWSLRYTRPLNERWQLHVELPWLKISGGMLDGFIENWHHTFGLPNGNRAGWAQNRLFVQHQAAGQVDFLTQVNSQHIGDVSVSTGRSWSNSNTHTALWLTVKLPTGNAALLTGSGTMDTAVTLGTEQRNWSRLTTYQQLSFSLLGKGERLSEQQRNYALSGLIGGDFHFTSHWDFTTQLSAHSGIYDSALRILGNSTQLSFGPVYQRNAWRSTLLVTEDIDVDTAPDVQFEFILTRRL